MRSESLISVCIPIYNGEAFLEAAIQSVLAQSGTAFEIILCDDYSQDNSWNICLRYADSESNVTALRNSARLGLVGNWNRCLELSHGDFVTIFHQDDLMRPDSIRAKAAFLSANEDVNFVFSDVDLIDNTGHVFRDHWDVRSPIANTGVIKGADFFEKLLLGDNFVCCPSVMLRKKILAKSGLFNPKFPLTVDWEMWLRLALLGDVGYVADRLIQYRVHQNNTFWQYLDIREASQRYQAKKEAIFQASVFTNSMDNRFDVLVSEFCRVLDKYINQPQLIPKNPKILTDLNDMMLDVANLPSDQVSWLKVVTKYTRFLVAYENSMAETIQYSRFVSIARVYWKITTTIKRMLRKWVLPR